MEIEGQVIAITGASATSCATDVTRPEDLTRLVTVAVERFGRLDALVASAGVATVTPLSDGTLAGWNQMVDVPGQGVYAATKAGVRALCEVLRQEVGPEIRATMACPGATDTEFTTDPVLRERMAAFAMSPDAVAEAIVYALAQPRDINVGEIVVRSAAQP